MTKFDTLYKQIIKESRNQILNEGMTETFLKPLFQKIVRALKQKAPEIFDKLATAKNPEELLGMLKVNKNQQQYNESMADNISKIKKIAVEFFAAIDHPVSGSLIMGLLGKIIMIAGLFAHEPIVVASGGVMGIAGLLFAQLGMELKNSSSESTTRRVHHQATLAPKISEYADKPDVSSLEDFS